MGGRIGVVSTVGVGSEFWFAVALPSAAGTEPEPVEPEGLRGLRMLVVDDNETNRRILAEQGAAWGMRVSLAASGAEARRVLATAAGGAPFDLAVLDMKMPDESGEELAAWMKAEPAAAAVPLILLSSLELNVGAERLREMGFAAHLCKPTRRNDLLGTIRAVIGKSRKGAPATPGGVGAGPVEMGDAARPGTGPMLTVGGAPLRVLLVEDNPVNQLVSSEMLKAAGCTVTVANDGREAVNAVARGFVDVVLMDCQMPEMDGFDATREIRRREGAGPAGPGLPAHLPIIALTANAISGDRERCLGAGMDDYLTKPINSGQLLEKLRAHLPRPAAEDQRGAAPVAGEGVNAAVGGAPAPAINYDELLHRCLDNPGLVAQVLALLVRDLPPRIEAVAEAVNAGDVTALEAAAHAIKGSAGNVAAGALAASAASIERRAAERALGVAAAELTGLLHEGDRCCAAARSLLETLKGP
jgi:CheY-like chemotaxis protein/HPt (histidine-containing phosphotransfer) domain-containing protein